MANRPLKMLVHQIIVEAILEEAKFCMLVEENGLGQVYFLLNGSELGWPERNNRSWENRMSLHPGEVPAICKEVRRVSEYRTTTDSRPPHCGEEVRLLSLYLDPEAGRSVIERLIPLRIREKRGYTTLVFDLR